MVSINDSSYDSQTQVKVKCFMGKWILRSRPSFKFAYSQPSKHAKVAGTTYVTHNFADAT